MRTERLAAILAPLFVAALLAVSFSGSCVSAAESAEDLFAQAEAKYRKGEYDEAVKLYRAMIAKFGSDAHAEDARYTSAFILQKKLGKHDEARKAYQEILERKAAAPMLANALYHLAESFEQSERLGQALKHYEEFAKRYPNDSRARLVNSKVEYLKNIGRSMKYPDGEKTEKPEKDKKDEDDKKPPRKPSSKTGAENAPPVKNEPTAPK